MVASAATALSERESADLHRTAPMALELREFVLRHTLQTLSDCADRALPVVSLRDVVVSLLDEHRHEEGVRFLAATGHPELLRDTRVVGGLLTVFRSTAQVEEDLKQRGAFLLKQHEKQHDDYNSVWVVDNERRRKIIQSQRRVLEYLASAETQFLRLWYDEMCGSDRYAFWSYIDELVAPPPHSADKDVGSLESEMHGNRMSLAVLLVKQMCADLADNLCTLNESLFVRASSEGVGVSGQVLYPAAFLDRLERYFSCALRDRGPGEALVKLVLDMLATATACGALPRASCVQTMARAVFYEPHLSRANALTRLFVSDTFALEVVDYMLSAWFNIDPESAGITPPAFAQAMSRPPSIDKTALRLYTACPPSKEDTPSGWCSLVGILGVLTTLTIITFCTRRCRINLLLHPGCAADTACPPVVALENSTHSMAPIKKALERLRERVLVLESRPNAVGDVTAALVQLDLLDLQLVT